jgi:tryptophan synthase beta chain
LDNSFKDYRLPDKRGHFKQFGGKYVPETLIPALEELEHQYDKSKEDSVFQAELYNLLKH